MAVGIYLIKPELYNISDVFYDKFYSGSALELRLENREIETFPKAIGDLALYGLTERGVGITVARDCRFSDPSICSKMYRLQYRDFKGNTYFVNISKFKETGDDEEIISLLKSIVKSTEGNFFKVEQHEIGWISEEKKSFLVIQKGVCSIVNNQAETCGYPDPISSDDEVVSVFSNLFPVSKVKFSTDANTNN